MTGVLLHSGNLQDYTALGDEGQPIHAVATQIREVIRLRVSPAAAQSLAIPRINENRSTVDWYASESGTVVPWSAATEIERAYALECLEGYRTEVTAGLTTLSGVSERERQVIQNLKDKIFTHPANNCVFLVNGKPVLTFWGFYAGQAPPVDPFSDLRAAPAAVATAAPGVVASAPVVTRRRPWWFWLLLLLLLLLLLFLLLRGCSSRTDPVVPGAVTPLVPVEEPDRSDLAVLEPADEPIESIESVELERQKRVPRDVDVVPRTGVTTERRVRDGEIEIDRLDSSIDRALATDEPIVELPSDAQVLDAPAALSDEPIIDGSVVDEQPALDQTLLPDGSEVNEQSVLADSELETSADAADDSVDPGNQDTAPTVTPPEIAVDPPESAAAPDAQTQTPATDGPQTPALGSRIAIPSDAARSGSVSFTDGRWRAAGGLQDSATGKPVQLWYEFKDGKGNVTVDKGGGVRCQTSATSQMQGDRLLIAPAPAIAPCADGTSLQLPTIECVPDPAGPANCQGVAADGSPLPIIIRQSP